MFFKFFSIFVAHFLWKDYVRRLAPFLSYICYDDFNKYSSKFTENFQVIVLKALRILNVNWEFFFIIWWPRRHSFSLFHIFGVPEPRIKLGAALQQHDALYL